MTIVEIIIFSIGIIGVILLANVLVVRGRRTEQLAFNWLLFLLNIPVLLIGVFFLVVPDSFMNQVFGELDLNTTYLNSVGLILILTAIWGFLVTIPDVRQLIARLLPIKPGSPVHTLALLMAGYLVGQSALTLSQGGLGGLAESAVPASIALFVLSEILFAIVGLFGVGFLVRRHGPQLAARLGLKKPQPIHLLAGIGWIGLLVILQTIAGAAWAFLNPEQAQLLEDLNRLLLAEVDNVWEWLILALAAGIGEEILFRGALQPVFGLGFTAVLFALVHVQYGYTPIMLFIVLLALILGLVRRYYNTTIAIFVHVGYDFTLGLLALLATYLEQYIT
jgi:membrane protease YdiL (CAAX protease family)